MPDWNSKLLAHVEMMRPYTMFHSGLVAVAGCEVASGGHAAAWRVVLAAVVTMCGWEAGLYAGDYYDREIDARSKPFRPVPSGRVSPREAFSTMVGLILVGYAAALVLGLPNLILAMLTTALGIAYSKTFKSQAILGNFDRGLLGVCAVLFGALAGGTLASWPVALLALLVFFHDSATNLVGAIRDVDGDRAAGCPTVPVVYGVTRAVEIAASLGALWLLAGLRLITVLPYTVTALVLFVVAAALAIRVYGTLLRLTLPGFFTSSPWPPSSASRRRGEKRSSSGVAPPPPPLLQRRGGAEDTAFPQGMHAPEPGGAEGKALPWERHAPEPGGAEGRALRRNPPSSPFSRAEEDKGNALRGGHLTEPGGAEGTALRRNPPSSPFPWEGGQGDGKRARGGVTRARALEAHKLLVVERLLLMSAFIAAYAPLAAVVLLAVTLAATVVSQIALRDRHERWLVTDRSTLTPQGG